MVVDLVVGVHAPSLPSHGVWPVNYFFFTNVVGIVFLRETQESGIGSIGRYSLKTYVAYLIQIRYWDPQWQHSERPRASTPIMTCFNPHSSCIPCCTCRYVLLSAEVLASLVNAQRSGCEHSPASLVVPLCQDLLKWMRNLFCPWLVRFCLRAVG